MDVTSAIVYGRVPQAGPFEAPDAIVIGAGQNGLVAANLLADAGWEVLCLEAAAEPGGAVKTGELTVPGFRHDLFSAFYPLAVASPVMQSLELERYGLVWRRAPLVLAHPRPDGSSVVISRDLEETAGSVERDALGDGDRWRSMIAGWESIRQPFLDALFHPFPPLLGAARLAGRLGFFGSLRLVRSMLLPVRRMAEETFCGEGAALLLAGCALHTDLSPEAAGSAAFGWLMSCLAQTYGFPVPRGGASGLIDALVARLESRGGSIQCGRPVSRVVIEGGRATGVRIYGGDEIRAKRAVIASVAAPHLYEKLVGLEHLPPAVVEDLARFEWDTATVKVDWALSEPIGWASAAVREAATVHVADDMDNLTEYASQLAMRRLPSRPFLIVGQQAQADDTRAPPGADTAWAYTHVPREIRADAAGELDVSDWVAGFVERIENRIESSAPGFRHRILGRHVFSPVELESADPNLVCGAINGGTAQLHQQLVFRPVPGWGRPETPVANLFLGSSSAHPGGGVHGGPGANAARAALRAFPTARSVLFGRKPAGWKS